MSNEELTVLNKILFRKKGVEMRKGSEIDKIDLKILSELQRNGRITNQDLAELVSMSPSSCLHRVRRLEDAGLISSFHARLNLKKMTSSITCFTSIRFTDHTNEVFKEFEAAIADLPVVLESYSVSGEFDYLLKVIARDMDEYVRFTDGLLGRLSAKVTISTHVVMNENKVNGAYPLDQLVEV